MIDSLKYVQKFKIFEKHKKKRIEHYPTRRSGSPLVADTLTVTLPQGPEQIAL